MFKAINLLLLAANSEIETLPLCLMNLKNNLVF